MKSVIICCVLIAQFAVIFAELPDIEDLLPKQLDIWSSYDDYVATLNLGNAAECVEYLESTYKYADGQMQDLYNAVRDFLQFVLDFYHLMENGDRDFKNCAQIRAREAGENLVQTAKKTVEDFRNWPTPQSCYENITKFINDYKNFRLHDHEEHVKGGQAYIEQKFREMDKNVASISEHAPNEDEFLELITKGVEEISTGINKFGELFYMGIRNYVNEMVGMKKQGASADDLRRLSSELKADYEQKIGKDIRETIDELKNEKQDMQKERDEAEQGLELLLTSCEQDSNSFDEGSKRLASMCTNDKVFMETLANFKVYIKKSSDLTLVDCNDHVPYFGHMSNDGSNSQDPVVTIDRIDENTYLVAEYFNHYKDVKEYILK